MYYALSDSFTGDNPQEAAHGFANTKEVIAFRTKKERDEWLENTNLLTAKALTRNEARKQTPWSKFAITKHDKVKLVRIYGSNQCELSDHVLEYKNY